MKDMTSVATTMMSEEEKADIERAMNAHKEEDKTKHVANDAYVHPTAATPGPADSSAPHSTTSSSIPASASGWSTSATGEASASTSAGTVDGATTPIGAAPGSSLASIEAEKERERKRRAEQREKLREHEDQRRKVMQERVADLTRKLIERLRPFVEAKDPGGKDDPETRAFEVRMKKEADDLKLESFGVEVRGSSPALSDVIQSTYL